MRLKFDYNEVSPETIKIVLEKLYKQLNIAEENRDFGIDIGSINLYISLRNSIDNSMIKPVNENNEDIIWTIKPYKMKNTNDREFYSTNDFIIYTNNKSKEGYL